MKSIWTYQDLLPPVGIENRILLGEGNTPLLKSKAIGHELGLTELYFKLENLNPTGSYKDRFAAAFVSLLQSRAVAVCLATSSGNTGAALAAYCGAANIKCLLAIVDGAPAGKIKQMQLYGASTYIIRDFGKDSNVTGQVFDILEATAAELNIPLPISAYRYCSEGMEGVQTLSYEIMEETGKPLHQIFSPAGGGGLTLAIARGIRIFCDKFPVDQIPKVNCVQPEGNDTIASALRARSVARAVPFSRTGISGLQVPNVLDGDRVIEECGKLNGNGYIVSDDVVFQFQRKLALQEGIFCEAAGAVALAGVADAVNKNEVSPDEKVVCIITGSGFKDMTNVDQHFKLTESVRLDTADALKGVLKSFI